MAGALSIAIDKGRWDIAALCLVLGSIEVMRRVPAESITEMMDLLGGETDVNPLIEKSRLKALRPFDNAQDRRRSGQEVKE